MIQSGVNDASYNCEGTPTRRPSQIIPVAVALWATKPRLPARIASHPPSRQLRRGKQRSGYSALGVGRGGTDYKIGLDAAFTPATARQEFLINFKK